MSTIGPSRESVRNDAQARADETGNTYYLRAYGSEERGYAFRATTTYDPKHLGEAIYPQPAKAKGGAE